MYVKSLTLRGFKSFASATTLRLEPGITCIVGPNGSGKSNVVDALAWVMGEQGAKSLRGGKMEDVIFAGTSGRPPLGRAEVTMTIDNSDGALPIDYAEVTLSRTMFRSGGSEYALNGTGCRLLDVQELLSDSGIGREMHVIVGQGQLDAVLRATPEDRRGFIEEAAGVLKHRKRKERALRKLEAMETNLARVQDLTAEIRRQLGPLGRQAETARRAAVIQAEARDARLRLLADDLIQLTSARRRDEAAEAALVAQRTEVEARLADARARLAAVEADAARLGPELSRAQDRWFALASLRERITAAGTLAAERIRLLSAEEEPQAVGGRRSGRDPEALRAQAEEARAVERALRVEIGAAQHCLSEAVTAREQAEQAAARERDRVAELVRAAADRREGLARLAGRVAARRSGIEAAEAEIGRLTEAIDRARGRAADAQREFARLEGRVAEDEEGEEGLDSAYEAAQERLAAAEQHVAQWLDRERIAERDRAGASARVEALELSLRRTDGARALLTGAGSSPAGVAAAAEGSGAADGGRRSGADVEPLGGVVGVLSDLLCVDPGRQAAVSAALGWATSAVVVDSLQTARTALARLREAEAGRVGLLVPPARGTADAVDAAGRPWAASIELPPGAVWASAVVGCPDEIRPTVADVLAGVVLVPDTDAAIYLVEAHPALTAVTPDADVYAPGHVWGGSDEAPSELEVAAALETARAAAEDATRRREQAVFALAAGHDAVTEGRAAVEAALADLHASDARMSAVAEQLGSWGAQARAAGAEADRLVAARTAAATALADACADLDELVRRLAEARSGHVEEPSTQTRDEHEAAAVAARATETEARLVLRTTQERTAALRGRADSLDAAARAEIAEREREAARREHRVRQVRGATAVHAAAGYVAARLTAGVRRADEERTRIEADRAAREKTARGLRGDTDELAQTQRDLTDTVHRDEMARAQQLLRIEQLQARAVDELGVDPDTLVEEFGPHRLVPELGVPADPADQPPVVGEGAPAETATETSADVRAGTPYVRDIQEKRLRRAERALAQLGRINPLALEEYAALEERHTFLTGQLEDLRKSKHALLDVVKEVDERVQRVFAEAYADTAREFAGVFARLFPGGEGRLTLTDPEDMLTTGIEVEARPPGKKIKRLSLLSGGERSLTAIALLVAIFKARPSPFYIMDEVEAALDDVNLERLLTLFDDLRESSQLIVITHQKRTMEIADALYGVAMRGDGVTTVVSQRIRDRTCGRRDLPRRHDAHDVPTPALVGVGEG